MKIFKETIELLSINDSLREKYLDQSKDTDSNFLIEALKLMFQ